MTALEQQIALLRDAMRARAYDAGSAAEGYCPVETAYENAASDAEQLLRSLEDVRKEGGQV